MGRVSTSKERIGFGADRPIRATAGPAVTSKNLSSQTLPYDIVPIARNFLEARVFID